MTKTWKISSVATIITALVGLIALVTSDYWVVTTGALNARVEPIECETLQNTIDRLRDERRVYKREYDEDPTDLFAEKQMRDREQRIEEKQARRTELVCP